MIEEVNVSSMLRGLRESILGHVLTKSGLESTGPFNPAKAYEMLFQPIKGVGGRRRQSLATWMRSNKLITDTELKTFEKDKVIFFKYVPLKKKFKKNKDDIKYSDSPFRKLVQLNLK